MARNGSVPTGRWRTPRARAQQQDTLAATGRLTQTPPQHQRIRKELRRRPVQQGNVSDIAHPAAHDQQLDTNSLAEPGPRARVATDDDAYG